MSVPGKEISDELVRQLTACGANVVQQAALSDYTTFKLGGTCPALIDCVNTATLKAVWSVLVEYDVPRILIGGGSNLLIHDAGLKQVVVRYVDPAASFKCDGTILTVSAGMNLDNFALQTAEAGLEGIVYCSGIPGTVGGAIAGNAGAFGEQIGDRIETVDVMNVAGVVRTVEQDELGFVYRRSAIQDSGDIILSATLRFESSSAEQLLTRRKEILNLRATKHPDWSTIPTAGSFFKNVEPTSKAGRRQAAGWFLEEAGALSMRVGGACTFAKHANIVIGEEGCKASDVLELSDMMAAAVKEKFDLTLHREVKLLGFE